MATRQVSKNGKAKSPRIQVVLPEDLCNELSNLANQESRTVSNMAKVLIQEGIKRYDRISFNQRGMTTPLTNPDSFRSSLESQESKRLKGLPKRLKFFNSQI